MHANAQAVAQVAREHGIEVEVREFPEGTRTAQDAAAAVGVELGQIVKSLVFAVSDEVLIALVSGVDRLDERRLGEVAGGAGGRAKRVDADGARAATGYPIGGVPPFGHARELRVFVDRALLAFDEVWAAGGTPRHVFGIAPADLVAVCHGTVADIAQARA